MRQQYTLVSVNIYIIIIFIYFRHKLLYQKIPILGLLAQKIEQKSILSSSFTRTILKMEYVENALSHPLDFLHGGTLG